MTAKPIGNALTNDIGVIFLNVMRAHTNKPRLEIAGRLSDIRNDRFRVESPRGGVKVELGNV